MDRDATIFRLMPETALGRHTISLNYMAIGVENIGGPKAHLTKTPLKANTDLIKWLSKKLPIEYVIGHHVY
ncbi:N-acetylmuramoyl-L-alanine amidase [Lunatibacter salilacus]|uniref:N-acetylmuramoyl-L-alanine amidase n=1 Tax=Lunatibacter salilacus TaxID=2483804 RepID=UPI0021D3CCB5|nr:N-acetylmuramoyl-L-alanine amidase [Lunatibacter salilacus]